MRNDKLQAIHLRKRGLSYAQIHKELGIPKSTLSSWLKEISLSALAKKNLSQRFTKGTEALIKRNKNQTFLAKERASLIKEEAKKEFAQNKENPFFILGVALYWAEGYKKGAYGSQWKCIDFANSDPKMIQYILCFFYSFLPIETKDIKIQIIAHENTDIRKAILYWKTITKIPKKQFIKTSVPNNKRRYGKKHQPLLTHGTVHVRIYSVVLFYRIIGWIEALKENNNGTVAQGLERSAQEVYFKQ